MRVCDSLETGQVPSKRDVIGRGDLVIRCLSGGGRLLENMVEKIESKGEKVDE